MTSKLYTVGFTRMGWLRVPVPPVLPNVRKTCFYMPCAALPARELYIAFHVPYIYDHITKLCRQQTEVIQNHANANVRCIGTGEARHRKYKKLILGGGQAYDRCAVVA
jgi:hypothetical protein